MAAKISQANTLKNNTVVGTDFGQYTSADRANLQAAIDQAQSVYDTGTTTMEYSNATTALNTAMETYKSKINSNPVSLLSTNAINYRWYWIRSYATNANATYAFGKVISEGTRTVGQKYTYEDKAATPTDVQLFRFELTPDQTKVLNIIDKTGKYVASNGNIATASTVGNDFTLTPLTDGVAFWIKPTTLDPIHAQQANADIVNWNNTAGSASAWVFDYALEAPKIPVGFESYNNNKYVVRVNKGIITVEGADKFEVYSVIGQKQNEKSALKSGAYIVKVNNFTQKVVIN